ncbi:Histone acetyltransferase [Mycena venus]|uniref:histone acetyltransferase n=1 Tax=Mycena venus TaxID=2733690 RepID=A0A8H6YMD0_9AGAR|nr:Histone acetyltransferase [Mycena venus]
MSPSNTTEEVVQGPPPITPGGTYTIQTVSVGCKIYARRPGSDGETEERLAEILSIRDKPVNAYANRNKGIKQEDSDAAQANPADKWEYFVHWDTFNKRLDEWVPGSRLILSRDLEWPRPKTPPRSASQNLLKKATSNAAFAGTPPPGATPSFGGFSTSPSPAPSSSLKRKLPHDEEEEEEEEEPEDEDADAEGEMDVDGEGETETFDLSLTEPAPESEVAPPPMSAFSKEQEIEKLRTSGSMTQSISEIARVKNLNRLQIGKHEVDAWYFSPYPKDDDISFYEIDGKRQLTWCRNLSLLSKCFLDHKTLYYDVTPFMYYVMAQRDSTGCHVIGYFSKEKESAENYNVACILTLPQHQRFGYGKLLIEFSYELSKKEGKLGSPEKPLSDLGLLGYRSYWADTILELLMNSGDGEMSIDDIAQKTSITHADVTNTCATLGLFKHYKGSHIICLNNAVLERYEKSKNKRKRRINPEHLRWKPPVFTRDQLRFGF